MEPSIVEKVDAYKAEKGLSTAKACEALKISNQTYYNYRNKARKHKNLITATKAGATTKALILSDGGKGKAEKTLKTIGMLLSLEDLPNAACLGMIKALVQPN